MAAEVQNYQRHEVMQVSGIGTDYRIFWESDSRFHLTVGSGPRCSELLVSLSDGGEDFRQVAREAADRAANELRDEVGR